MNRNTYRGKYAGQIQDFKGKWVYGDLVTIKPILRNKMYIHPHCNSTEVTDSDLAKCLVVHPVNPETVGQATGILAAKSYRNESEGGRMIFEGDRVRDKFEAIYEVDYCEPWAAFRLKKIWGKDEDGIMSRWFTGSESFTGNKWREWEIIGTIHDATEE